MRRHYITFSAIACSLLLFFSACNNVPENARYIPKDAVMVLGINTNQLSQKVAWNMIAGSKLFKEMQQQMPDTSAANIDQAGIDISNTIYLYMKGDDQTKSGGRLTALVPLDDAGKWETYVKKAFPQAAIQSQDNIKMVSLDNDLYAGWNNKLLIVQKNWSGYQQYYTPGDTTVHTTAPAADNATMAAALKEAFNIPDDNRIVDNKHFKELQKGHHDLTLWVNYSQLMQKGAAGRMGSFSLSQDLWKDAAVAASLDFEKGRIVGEGKYYVSKEMADIYKQVGDKNADKEMINRLPVQNLDMLGAWHISPDGLKKLLEKMGVLGFANIALSQQGINADYVFDAFTGDMAVTMNNFSLMPDSTAIIPGDSAIATHTSSYKPRMDVLFVLKINKKENFRKILQIVGRNGLMAIDNNTYAAPISQHDSVFVMTDDTYAVITNKSANGYAYLHGDYKGNKLPDAASDVYGHPSAFYVDVRQFTKDIDAGAMTHTAQDSARLASAKELIDNIMMDGGSFKDGAFTHHISINFMNKDENSLLELIDFGIKMRDAGTDTTVVANK